MHATCAIVCPLTSGLLGETTRPNYVWTKVQEATETVLLHSLIKEFIDKDLTRDKFIGDRAGRHGLQFQNGI